MDRRAFLTLLMSAAGAMVVPLRMARADERFTGDFEQGGMVMGRTDPAAKVTLDGKAVRVSPEGIYVFGFGRDQAKSAQLVITLPGMKPQSETLTIVQREYKIQRINGLPDDKVTPPPDAIKRIERDNQMIGEARSHDTLEIWFADGIDWPVKGPVTGDYGSQRILNGEPRRPHFGVDIAKGEGEPIHAPAKGIVRLAEPDMYFTGGTTIIDHGGGITTSYLHQSRQDVKLGDTVEKGAVIGAIGKTGRATGPHLCWRLNWFQERLDPQLAAPPMPG
jgi:murein DD-endopeptidase MepM/ murein hydrolase activator NlpD